MKERDVDIDAVRREHLAEVDQRRQWLYLAVVPLGGLALMLLLIVALDMLS